MALTLGSISTEGANPESEQSFPVGIRVGVFLRGLTWLQEQVGWVITKPIRLVEIWR